MEHSLISIPNDSNLAGRLGKKGSENGVTFYNRRDGDRVFVIIAPTNPETKFNAVAETLTISDNVLISTAKLDRLFAESIIGCSLLGKRITLTQDNDASEIMKVSKIAYETVAESEVFGHFGNADSKDSVEPIVEVDHAFNVKGIGTVLLGIVRQGTVRVHDSLYMGDGRAVGIRSIQSQDQDVQEAGRSTRVGLAVKGVEPDDIEKGDILSSRQMAKIDKISANVRVSGMVKEKHFDYSELWLVCGFRSSLCRVTLEGNSYGISLSARLSLSRGDNFLLVRKSEPRIFASGSVL